MMKWKKQNRFNLGFYIFYFLFLCGTVDNKGSFFVKLIIDTFSLTSGSHDEDSR
jgi:hypothetical protein